MHITTLLKSGINLHCTLIYLLLKIKIMTTSEKTKIRIQTTVTADLNTVWQAWTQADHIIRWNNPSPDWHTPQAENDVRPGGKFNFRMEAKDGSMGFNFTGTYDSVEKNKLIEYTMDDSRFVKIQFIKDEENTTSIIQEFEAEDIHPVEFQKAGWQGILDNFKNYTETLFSNN
jgi:uncharacterized protein YndB with AHSA1/START domain